MSSSIAVTVVSTSPEALIRAQTLSQELGLPLVPSDSTLCEVELAVSDTRLELREPGRETGPVYVEFVGGRMGKRRQRGWAHDPLVKAVTRKGERWRVVDATAGLGRDTFVLALAGCQVTAVERSAAIAALLDDGLQRAAAVPELAPIIDRIHLVRGDARTMLAALPAAERPNTVYLDPMFPHRAKTALSKKEMRVCRLVAGEDPDADDLLAVARRVAGDRVVVKRWLHAPPLAPEPAIQFKGKSIRYDVYLPGGT